MRQDGLASIREAGMNQATRNGRAVFICNSPQLQQPTSASLHAAPIGPGAASKAGKNLSRLPTQIPLSDVAGGEFDIGVPDPQRFQEIT